MTDDAAQTRAELESLAHRFEALIRERLRGIALLEWVDEIHEDELMGISAFVRPARAHSGGVTVTVHQGAELGMAIGPSVERFRTGRPTRYEVAGDGPLDLNAVLIEIDRATGRAVTIRRVDRAEG